MIAKEEILFELNIFNNNLILKKSKILRQNNLKLFCNLNYHLPNYSLFSFYNQLS